MPTWIATLTKFRSVPIALLALELFTGFALAACASDPTMEDPPEFTSGFCQNLIRNPQKEEDTDEKLDRVTQLFNDSCFKETIALGRFILGERRDKFYSVSSEMIEVLTPEGSLTPYILESYERSYLSVLMSLSYLRLGKENEAQIELRRTIREENAILYNYGTDPILTLMQAALWDRFDPLMARPFWKKLSEYGKQDARITLFAKKRIEEIDARSFEKVRWQIVAIGQLPKLDWHTDLFKSDGGPYDIEPVTKFPEACSSEQAIFVPTSSWVEKIASKYDSGYHPLMYVKSLTRLPFGLGYGIVGVTTGIGVGVGGCVIGLQAKGDAGAKLCEVSMAAGGYVIGQSANLTEYTLRPDLRHWKNLPIAVLVTREDAASDVPCSEAATILPRVHML